MFSSFLMIEIYVLLFSAEVGRNFSPFFGFPFQDTGGIGVSLQPFFCPFNQQEEFFCFRGSGEFGLALLLSHPADGIRAVTLNGHIETFLFKQRQPVYDG